MATVRPLYSKLLYSSGAVPTTSILSYSVPAGYVTDVRDIVFYNQGYEPWQPIDGVSVSTYLDGAHIYTVRAPFIRSFTTYHWSGRQILNYGDGFIVLARALGWTARVTGYELTTP